MFWLTAFPYAETQSHFPIILFFAGEILNGIGAAGLFFSSQTNSPRVFARVYSLPAKFRGCDSQQARSPLISGLARSREGNVRPDWLLPIRLGIMGGILATYLLTSRPPRRSFESG